MSLAVSVWAYYTNSREISHFVPLIAVGLKKGGGGEVLAAPAFLIDSDFLAPQNEWSLNKVVHSPQQHQHLTDNIVKRGKVMELSNSSHFPLWVNSPDVSHLRVVFSFATSASALQRQMTKKASLSSCGPCFEFVSDG